MAIKLAVGCFDIIVWYIKVAIKRAVGCFDIIVWYMKKKRSNIFVATILEKKVKLQRVPIWNVNGLTVAYQQADVHSLICGTVYSMHQVWNA